MSAAWSLCAKADMEAGSTDPRFMMGWTPPDGIDVPKWRC